MTPLEEKDRDRLDNYARQADLTTGGYSFADTWQPTGPQRRRLLHKRRSRKTHFHDGSRCLRCRPLSPSRPSPWRESGVSTEDQLARAARK